MGYYVELIFWAVTTIKSDWYWTQLHFLLLNGSVALLMESFPLIQIDCFQLQNPNARPKNISQQAKGSRLTNVCVFILTRVYGQVHSGQFLNPWGVHVTAEPGWELICYILSLLKGTWECGAGWGNHFSAQPLLWVIGEIDLDHQRKNIFAWTKHVQLVYKNNLKMDLTRDYHWNKRVGVYRFIVTIRFISYFTIINNTIHSQ